LPFFGFLLVLALTDYFHLSESQQFATSSSEVFGIMKKAQFLALLLKVSHRLGLILLIMSYFSNMSIPKVIKFFKLLRIEEKVYLEAIR
jgi:hypothetical protein